jgi:hypothetical protein
VLPRCVIEIGMATMFGLFAAIFSRDELEWTPRRADGTPLLEDNWSSIGHQVVGSLLACAPHFAPYRRLVSCTPALQPALVLEHTRRVALPDRSSHRHHTLFAAPSSLSLRPPSALSATTITPTFSASALASITIATAPLATTSLTVASPAGVLCAVLTVFRSQIAWTLYLSGEPTAPRS